MACCRANFTFLISLYLLSQAFSSRCSSSVSCNPHRSCFQFQIAVLLYRIMCDVPITAVFCSESVECFAGMASKCSFKPFVSIPVAPVPTGIITHLMFHIRCFSIHKLLYFSSFFDSFCITFLSAGIATSVSIHDFSFLFLIIISGQFATTSLSVCTS